MCDVWKCTKVAKNTQYKNSKFDCATKNFPKFVNNLSAMDNLKLSNEARPLGHIETVCSLLIESSAEIKYYKILILLDFHTN